MGSREKMQAFQVPAKRHSECLDFLKTLLDESSFAEQDSFIRSPSYIAHERAAVPGDGLICGSGSIDRMPLLIAAQDAEVYKGAVGHIHAQKFIKICRQAKTERLPLLAIFESAGVRAEEGLQALKALGDMLNAFADTAKHVPSLAIVKGHVAGALSLLLPHATAVIMLAEKSGIYFQGPGVTKAQGVTTLSMQDIGGSKIHAEMTGLAAFVAQDEKEVAGIVKQLLSYRKKQCDWTDDPNRLEAELNEIAEASDEGLDIQKVTNLLFDKNSLLPVYRDFCPSCLCQLARIGGVAVAVISQHQAPVTCEVVEKIKRFLRIANAFELPLITLNGDIKLEAGLAAEHGGIVYAASELAELLQHYESRRLNVYLGQAYATALLISNSGFMGCRASYAWPTAELGLINGEQALSLFGAKDLEESRDPIKDRAQLTEKLGERYSSLADAAAAGLIDEVIWPESTRPYLYRALQRSGDAI